MASPPARSDDAYAPLVRWASIASICVASTLILAKAWAWISNDSVALLSTLVDSTLDFGASLITLFAVRQALVPADKEHRYGHGKAEALAGMAQSSFIGGSGAFLILQAGEHLLHPVRLNHPREGYAVMLLSIVLTTLLVLFQHYVTKRTQSVAIGADSLHYKMDLLINIGVLASLYVVSVTGWLWLDGTTALIIACYILMGAWKVFRQSLDVLMDRELDDKTRDDIIRHARTHHAVKAVENLRTRSSGQHTFVELSLRLDGTISLCQAHHSVLTVKATLRQAYPQADVSISMIPD